MTQQKMLIGTYRLQVLGSDGLPKLKHPANWRGLFLERLVIPTRGECGPQFSGMPVVFASRNAPGRRWFRSNGKYREVPSEAPGLDLLSSAYERDYERWESEPGGETLCLRLQRSVLERYMQEDAYHFDLDTRYSHRDDFLVDHLFLLAEEIQQGMPNGALFSDGLSSMILSWLASHYARMPASSHMLQKRSLSAAQQATVRELIEAHLDSELHIEVLSKAIGTSPCHFSRLFKSAFGMPPHRYVIQLRIARATNLLRMERQLTIAEIANMTGFSSQAHFTSTFRNYKGVTPARWRGENRS